MLNCRILFSFIKKSEQYFSVLAFMLQLDLYEYTSDKYLLKSIQKTLIQVKYL